MFRVLIVDDEPHARATVRRLLRMDPDCQVVGECFGPETPNVIRETQPDIVFLDVQMPEMSGLDVLRAVPPSDWPLVIFISAHQEHALTAFEVNAVDYLLKPFTDIRFMEALRRAKQIVHAEESAIAQRRLVNLLLETNPSSGRSAANTVAVNPPSDRLAFKEGGRTIIVRASDIIWVEAEGAYSRIHGSDRNTLVRHALAEFESMLDPSRFFRVHRSAIVNLDFIQETRHVSHGDYRIILRNGVTVKLSRSRREEFDRRLGLHGSPA